MNNIELYFKRSNGERIFLGNPDGIQDTLRMVNEHLKGYPKFKSYYTRIWTEPDDEQWHCHATWIDVGSHSEFYIVKGLDMKDFSMNRERSDMDEN